MSSFPYFRDADVTALFQDAVARGLAVAVVIGATQLSGIVDWVGRDVLASLNVAGVSATTITVTVQTSALPSPLPNKTALTVAGQAMVLRDRLQEGDGALTHLFCERT